MLHPKTHPCLLMADGDGNISEFPDLFMTGASNGKFFLPKLDDLIPLPAGSELFSLPGRDPIGWDNSSNEPVVLTKNPYTKGKVQAVGAFIAPAHTSILTTSYNTRKNAPILPLFAYTAVGWHRGQFWVAGFRSDPDKRQDINQYHQSDVANRTQAKLKLFKHNRLIQHLGKCCLTYGCPAARNYFLERWEAPLPTSPTCNARCLGCISLQPSGCCRATQDRITFVPTVDEIREIAVPHLETAENAIVSFGQGCEGEPLLQAEVIARSIAAIRNRTERGTINLNSNSSLPDKVALLAKAGLDSIRVSLNSAQELYYHRYYRPQHYGFSDVLRSIDVMKEQDRMVSLNYFVLPGFTDSLAEYQAFRKLVKKHQPDFIQLRNLNIDPEWYVKNLKIMNSSPTLGIRSWLSKISEEFPVLRFGYFNPQKSDSQKKSS